MASTTVELGGPGLQELPGASSTSRSRPSPLAVEPGVAVVGGGGGPAVVVGWAVVTGWTVVVVGGTVVTAPGPGDNCPLNGPVTEPGAVNVPASVGWSKTVTGWPGLPSTP